MSTNIYIYYPQAGTPHVIEDPRCLWSGSRYTRVRRYSVCIVVRMIVRHAPLWQSGQCTSENCTRCNCTDCTQMVVACHADGCTEKRCDQCPGMDSCQYCGLPFCDRHNDLQDHTCLGPASWVPQCPWCKLAGRAAKQRIGWAHSCEACFQPTCEFDGACPTQILECDGICGKGKGGKGGKEGKEVCGFCGRWYQLPGPERRVPWMFYCHACAVHRHLLDGADVLLETVHGRPMLRPWWSRPPPASSRT